MLRGKDLPSFLITLDTEGDNLWARSKTLTTNNSLFLPRFQALCDSFGFKPTYLTNYEMASCPMFQEFGKGLLGRGNGEIGMHLHAWNSPPLIPLTTDDSTYHPYLIEYPHNIMEQKIVVMTELLETTFSTKMISHRAGRWSFNAMYAKFLEKFGYRIDCSVAPLISYKHHLGHPEGSGGTDYTHFPNQSYFLHQKNISRSGKSSILEVPMTIIQPGQRMFLMLSKIFQGNIKIRELLSKIFPILQFRPNGRNRKDLLRIVQYCHRHKKPYIEFMLHSSELMPGGSPTFKTERSIELLYEDLECVFELVKEKYVGATLAEYYQKVSRK